MTGITNSQIKSGGMPADNYCYLNKYITEVRINDALPEEYTLEIPDGALIRSFYNTFYSAPNDNSVQHITIVGSTGLITNWGTTFCRRKALTTITGELDFTSATSIDRPFIDCSALVSMRFKSESLKKTMAINSSPNLDTETLASIINGLADLTGGTAQTLTLHATAKANLTAEQLAAATAKNWTIA